MILTRRSATRRFNCGVGTRAHPAMPLTLLDNPETINLSETFATGDAR